MLNLVFGRHFLVLQNVGVGGGGGRGERSFPLADAPTQRQYSCRVAIFFSQSLSIAMKNQSNHIDTQLETTLCDHWGRGECCFPLLFLIVVLVCSISRKEREELSCGTWGL